MYDVIIIGAGIIGAFIGRELSKYNLKIALLDKENDIANGTTKANTAIVHAGYDATANTKMSKFNVRGNEMFDEVCKALDVKFERIGSLVLAYNQENMATLEELYKRGIENGVKGLEIISKEEVIKREPNISEEIKGALYAPTCGIVDPWNLAIALVENAMDNGMELYLNNEVVDIEKECDNYIVTTNKSKIKAKIVINCGGLYSDEISKLISSDISDTFEITPRRGEYFILDKEEGGLFSSVIFQCPTKMSKGVVVAPTVHGNIIIGPNAEDIDDKESLETTKGGLDFVKESAKKVSSKIDFRKTIKIFSGLRAVSDTGDFIVEESKDSEGFINVGGIKSPGLTSAPAIAEYVKDMVVDKMDKLGNVERKRDFSPIRRKQIRFAELNNEEKNEMINKNKRYGNVVCRCESITEGEIVDCIRRNGGATTVDGVKKRVRPGSGRCQGGFCQPKVIEILARELEKEKSEIRKDSENSYILIGETNKGAK